MDFVGFEPCRGLHLDLPEIEGSPFMAVMFYWKVKFLTATALPSELPPYFRGAGLEPATNRLKFRRKKLHSQRLKLKDIVTLEGAETYSHI